MVKYETTIKVQCQDKIPDTRTIFENLFFRKPELAQKSEKLIYLIIEKKRLSDKEWQETQKALGATHQEYYTVLNKLRDAGMITKQSGTWIVSEQFANRCQEMGDIWQSLVKKWKKA